jgi:hypothetical protein
MITKNEKERGQDSAHMGIIIIENVSCKKQKK